MTKIHFYITINNKYELYTYQQERQESRVVMGMNSSQNAWAQILALPFTSCVALDK